MNLTELIESGGANPVLLFVFALALGALHGLEPGHSKTMMAAYIIAIQGTVKQAILLGASAAFSHSIIVWILAIVALTWGNALIGEQLEPYFLIVSGLLILGIAAWMFWQSGPNPVGGHDHDHGHDHGHSHSRGHDHGHHSQDDALNGAGLDAHARAHALEIKDRIASGRIGTGQTILFGLSGGLIPCPAAITIFILCLHLGKLALGITLVSAFSVGLAITLMGIGVVAALGLKVASRRGRRLDRVFEAAPWISAALIAGIGLVILWTGYSNLEMAGHGHDH